MFSTSERPLPIKPVLRKPRRQWLISTSRSEPQPQLPPGIKALIVGTTPLAREVLRKLFFGLEQRLAAHGEPVEQVAAWLEERLVTFWALQPEFTLLLSRLWGGEHEAWLEANPRSLAILLVLGTIWALELKKRQSAGNCETQWQS